MICTWSFRRSTYWREMASQVVINPDTQTSPKLPALRDGQNSLVCQEALPTAPTPREQATEWAKDVRSR